MPTLKLTILISFILLLLFSSCKKCLNCQNIGQICYPITDTANRRIDTVYSSNYATNEAFIKATNNDSTVCITYPYLTTYFSSCDRDPRGSLCK